MATKIHRIQCWRKTSKTLMDRIRKRGPGLSAWLFLFYFIRKEVGYDFPMDLEDKKEFNDAARSIGWRPENHKPHLGAKGFAGAMGHEMPRGVRRTEDEGLQDEAGDS